MKYDVVIGLSDRDKWGRSGDYRSSHLPAYGGEFLFDAASRRWKCTLPNSRPRIFDPRLPEEPPCVMALSDARDYVLAVEHNKQEAAEIAKSAAQSW